MQVSQDRREKMNPASAYPAKVGRRNTSWNANMLTIPTDRQKSIVENAESTERRTNRKKHAKAPNRKSNSSNVTNTAIQRM